MFLPSQSVKFYAYVLMICGFWLGTFAAQSHEIRPALLEFQPSQTQADQLDITLDMTAEIFLSGIDAAGLEDTDDSEKAEEYTAFRSQGAARLKTEMRANWPRLADAIWIENGGQKLALTLSDISIETGLLESQIRQTRLTFNARPFDPAMGLVISWQAKLGPLIVRQASPSEHKEGAAPDTLYAAYLQAGEKTDPIFIGKPEQTALSDILIRYLKSGFVHIIPLGLDHILFVLGLFLFSLSGRILIYQISLFTLAHTLTLALSSLGILRLSPQLVEPLIALSITYVAFEVLWAKGVFSLKRGGLIVAFGLLHGLGFASVLSDFGLPDSHFLPALISFNLGVEIGQIAIVAPLFLLIYLARPPVVIYRRWIQIPAACLIGCIGLYWTLERVGWLAF